MSAARLHTPAQRAVAGAISIVLFLALTYLGTRIALGALSDDYRISVNVGQLGQGIVTGSDVKIRGVLVGRVGAITLNDDLQAVAELVLQPQYAVPERATFTISGKTLLGEKQVEVVFDGPADEGPFLAEGTLVDDPDRVVEFQDVLAELAELFEAIDPDDLAVLINDGVGAFDNQATEIARAVDEGERATDLGVRLLDDQVPATRDLSLVAESLGPRGDDFNRLAGELNAGLPTLTDNQEPLHDLLTDLAEFSAVLDATLEVDRANLDRMIIDGDSVTRMLFAYAPEVGELIQGITSYTSNFPEGFVHPSVTGQAARFQIFLREEGLEAALCRELPPELTSGIEGCADFTEPAAGSGAPANQSAPVPLLRLPAPPDLLRPDVPERTGIDALLRSTLGDGGQRD